MFIIHYASFTVEALRVECPAGTFENCSVRYGESFLIVETAEGKHLVFPAHMIATAHGIPA